MTNTLLAGLIAAAVLSGCAGFNGLKGRTAEAVLAPTQGSNAMGLVLFTEVDGGLVVEAEINGLKPGGHGFHIHEKGDCSAPDGMSAGGHFNPTGKSHGHPDKPDHHIGDLPMLVADASGSATLSTLVMGPSIRGDGRTNIMGRSVIVHAAADDYTTQPTGNSGARLACGVIVAK